MSVLISIENFYFVEKQTKGNFVKFVDSGFVKTWDDQNSKEPQKVLLFSETHPAF